MALTACNNDIEPTCGEQLPEGDYPLELKASGVASVSEHVATSRSVKGNDNWADVEEVSMWVNKEIRNYSVTTADNGKTATLTSDNPFYWTSTDEIKKVRAWYPTTFELDKEFTLPIEWKDEDFAKYDIIGVTSDIKFGDRNQPLVFKHLFAKVVVNLRMTDYVANAKQIKVQTTSASGWPRSCVLEVFFFDRDLRINSNHDKTDVITLCKLPDEDMKKTDFGNGQAELPFASYAAYMTPINLVGPADVIVTIDGVRYKYTRKGTLDSPNHFYVGKATVFNLTVKRDGLDVTVEPNIGWELDGESGSGNIEID